MTALPVARRIKKGTPPPSCKDGNADLRIMLERRGKGYFQNVGKELALSSAPGKTEMSPKLGPVKRSAIYTTVAADCLEVAGVASREDSLADSRALVGYWAAATVVVSLLVACFQAVSKHSNSDARAYSARPPGKAECSGDSRSDLVCLPTGVRALHPAR